MGLKNQERNGIGRTTVKSTARFVFEMPIVKNYDVCYTECSFKTARCGVGKAERLDKILANLGVGSRKDLKLRIKRGEVAVDGVVVRDPEEKFDPETASLAVCGVPVRYRRYLYLMMHKPAGYLTATEDRNAATVLDLLDEQYRGFDLFPAGRLDKDSEGLLLLTNDGALTHKILSPKNHVDKLYYIRYEGAFAPDAEKRFAEGLPIDGGYVCMPAILERLGENEAYVTIREGKYHQVKRMAEACGAHVVYLKRLRMGSLVLDESLPLGKYRMLSDTEEANLLKCFKSE